jgi:hypothetical protein
MTKALRFLAALLLAVPLLAQAQQRAYSQPELDQMLAPVALYPDALLSQVLMAASYPDEVREAADWSRANPGLQGEDAVRAVEYRDWDPSVKSLAAFPQLLARMAEDPRWTQSLGDAFLAQEPQVMDTVQQLRRRAQAAGNLQSSEQMSVRQQDQAILIQPASPQYVYVPYYDPYVVYGPWWWPAFRPVYWTPWRQYVVRVSPGFFFANFNWRHRYVRVVNPTAYYYRPTTNRAVAMAPQQRWQPEPQRRETFAGRQVRHVEPQQRQQVRAQVSAAPAVQVQPAVQARPQATPPAPLQARMPPAVAPQQPRAERHEHHEPHQEPRNERGPRGRERS